LLTHKKILTIYFSVATLLASYSFYLCFLEIRHHQAEWDKQQISLSFKQQSEWNQKQAQISQDLLVKSQSLLLDASLINLIKNLSHAQQENPALPNQTRQLHHAQLYSAFDPYWQQMHAQNLSELNLYFSPGLSVLQMQKRDLITDNFGPIRPELVDVFQFGKTINLFSVSRQGTAYRLLIPVIEKEKTLAVIELASQLEPKSSAAALLHKQLVDILLWDDIRKQLNPTLVGNWRLEDTVDPVAEWWQQGLVVAEKQQQIIHTSEGKFLISWIDHSTRRLALLIWSDISTEFNAHQKSLHNIYLKWLVFLLFLQLVLWLIYLFSKKQHQALIDQYQKSLSVEHQEVEQAHARLALALRSSNSGFWEWNIVKNRIRFSPEWRQLLKLPAGDDEMDLEDWVNLLDPNYRRSHHADMMNHLKGLTPMFENEYRIKTGDGEHRWILSRGKVIERDASGRALQIIGVYTDVTDKKNTELISVRQQAALQTLNEITSLPINDVDDQLKRALILAAKYLGVTTAGISNIEKKSYKFRVYVDVRGKTLAPYVDLEKTFCSLVYSTHELVAEDNIPQSIYADHPALKTFGHESYIGTPMLINGVIQGTLFFSAPKSRERIYDQLEKDFVLLLARWAGAIIDRSIQDAEKKIIIERFKKLSEHLPGFLYQYQLRPDGSSFYPYASPGIYNIYGLTAEDVSTNAEKIFDVFHPDDLGWIAETISYSATCLTPWVATVRVNNPNRGLLWINVQSIPEKLEDGSVLWHGYVSDISSLKNAELKLERTNAMQQAILDAASVAIITTDTKGLIKTFNRGAELMLGYSPEELIDKQTPEIFHKLEEVVARVDQLSGQFGYQIKPGFGVFVAKAKEGRGDETEWTYIRKDGTAFPVLLTLSALRNKFGEITGYLGIAHDISEIKRVDQQKNEFVSTVSHELRTPLTSISGALGLVVNGLAGKLPDQASKMINVAHNNALRLIHLVNDLLDMEKLLAGEMKFDLQSHSMMDLIKGSVEANAAYAAEFGVGLEVSEQADDPLVYVDRQRIAQVLANFISNAVKFSPEKSSVRINCAIKTNRVRVSIEDAGPGIPDEFRNRIFQKFSQADSSDVRQKGTGLGLVICKELIERLGGKVGFSSVVGQGACFYFELPIVKNNKNPGSDFESDAKEMSRRILVIEDEEDFAEYLKSLFESRNFIVDVAVTGNLALEYLESRSYDLVTLDLFLPDMNGIEIVKQLRAKELVESNSVQANNSENPSSIPLPVVIISTNPDDGKRKIPESMQNAKGIYWIQKPMIEGEPMLTVDYALLLVKRASEE
jgi:PAS domain S-box-containing protein